jgi:ubiquitin conjugation factor E4 B
VRCVCIYFFQFRQLTAVNASSEEISAYIEAVKNEKTENNVLDSHRMESQEASCSGSNNADAPLSSQGKALIKKDQYSFICECFFMTARVLNLGLNKALSDFKHIAKVCLMVSFYYLFVM